MNAITTFLFEGESLIRVIGAPALLIFTAAQGRWDDNVDRRFRRVTACRRPPAPPSPI
ncbi:hypothetical protein [Rhodospirillum rubrum]|uniref:hypothetical protein n=1 Tax=Rhodospirillum rubrum TaxID=1085 RepID=UPI00130542AD|nr:hypothetical protein [Rhodospirillum rubrum]QXG82168.1 hypothetical protein KUL73_09010 [Rhodospirillum rubrum]